MLPLRGHKVGWLVNDYLTCIPGTVTLWHDLLKWIPKLENCTGTPYPKLADTVEAWAAQRLPDYIIRNASYFRWLNINVPQISLMQDIGEGMGREMQITVCQRSSAIVWNSEYTKSFYPELVTHPVRQKVIPLSVDFSMFMPSHEYDAIEQIMLSSIDERLHDFYTKAFAEGYPIIMFVGSTNPIKGWNLFSRLIDSSPNYRFIVVLKDNVQFTHPRCLTYHNVDHGFLAKLYRLADLGVCTSVKETQHLAGLEMGASGIPLVTTNVGTYYNRPPGIWGSVFDGTIEDLEGKAQQILDEVRNPWDVRRYWTNQGIQRTDCAAAWTSLVEDICKTAP